MYFPNLLYVAAGIANVVINKKKSKKQEATGLNKVLNNWTPKDEEIS